MAKKEITKNWRVEYDHKDGRKGTVEATTIVGKSDGFQYGNGKYGALIIGDTDWGYDLRWNTEKDLHRAILRDYFGKGLVKATQI